MSQDKDASIIRQLKGAEIDTAVELFAEAIPRCWPNTVEEARQWVTAEFHHPESVVIGHLTSGILDEVVCLTPFTFVLSNLRTEERELVETALAACFPTINHEQIIHVGGLAITEESQGIGLVTLLSKIVESEATERGYKLCIGHTARRSAKYLLLKMLDRLAKRINWKELPVPQKIYYPAPSDLEKVWCYKPC